MRKLQIEGNLRRKAYLDGCTEDLGGLLDLQTVLNDQQEFVKYAFMPIDVEEPWVDQYLSPILPENMEVSDVNIDSLISKSSRHHYDPYRRILKDVPNEIITMCKKFSMVIAGGFACYAMRMVYANHWGDIDIFVPTSHANDFVQIINYVRNVIGVHTIYRTPRSLNFQFERGAFQIVCATFDSISQLLHLFDIPAAQKNVCGNTCTT